MQQIEKTAKVDQYQTDFVCTYQLITESDESEILYQTQFLQAFNLERFDDTIINNITEDLFKNFENNEYIQKLMAYYDSFQKKEIQFRLCFSYGSFHVMHRILCAELTNKQLTKDVVDNLFNKLALE
jgi:hypothetical protein